MEGESLWKEETAPKSNVTSATTLATTLATARRTSQTLDHQRRSQKTSRDYRLSVSNLVSGPERNKDLPVDSTVFCRLTADGLTMLLPLSLAGVNANFVVDTGAAVTIISCQVFGQIDAGRRPALRNPTVQHLVVADNRRLEIEGMATVSFCAGEQCFQWDMFVAPIKEDGLLGLDFLCAQDYAMDKSSLVLNQRMVPVTVTGGDVQAVTSGSEAGCDHPSRAPVRCQRGSSGGSTRCETLQCLSHFLKLS